LLELTKGNAHRPILPVTGTLQKEKRLINVHGPCSMRNFARARRFVGVVEQSGIRPAESCIAVVLRDLMLHGALLHVAGCMPLAHPLNLIPGCLPLEKVHGMDVLPAEETHRQIGYWPAPGFLSSWSSSYARVNMQRDGLAGLRS
jgi:hypothetical protein